VNTVHKYYDLLATASLTKGGTCWWTAVSWYVGKCHRCCEHRKHSDCWWSCV